VLIPIAVKFEAHERNYSYIRGYLDNPDTPALVQDLECLAGYPPAIVLERDVAPHVAGKTSVHLDARPSWNLIYGRKLAVRTGEKSRVFHDYSFSCLSECWTN
jgi:hypothetical protein